MLKKSISLVLCEIALCFLAIAFLSLFCLYRACDSIFGRFHFLTQKTIDGVESLVPVWNKLEIKKQDFSEKTKDFEGEL